MIHELLRRLKKTDERIRLLKEQIDDTKRIKAWIPRGVKSTGIGRPSEMQAIKLAELEDYYSQTVLKRQELSERLNKEKNECGDVILWELMWEHFYLGYTWKKTAERHNMKESAVKMRFTRFLNKSRRKAFPLKEKYRYSGHAAIGV